MDFASLCETGFAGSVFAQFYSALSHSQWDNSKAKSMYMCVCMCIHVCVWTFYIYGLVKYKVMISLNW